MLLFSAHLGLGDTLFFVRMKWQWRFRGLLFFVLYILVIDGIIVRIANATARVPSPVGRCRGVFTESIVKFNAWLFCNGCTSYRLHSFTVQMVRNSLLHLSYRHRLHPGLQPG